MATSDYLENKYNADVEFVAGESPIHTKFNNWDIEIEDFADFVCAIIGDVSYSQMITPIPPFITNLARSIGSLEGLGPQVVVETDDDTDKKFTWKMSVEEGVFEFKLDYSAVIDGVSFDIIDSSSTSWLDKDKKVTSAPPAAAGEWEIVTKSIPGLTTGVVTSVIRTYTAAPASAYVIYTATKDGYLNSDASATLNVIPTIIQAETPSIPQSGLVVTEDDDYYIFEFPTHRIDHAGTSLPTEHGDYSYEAPSIPYWIFTEVMGSSTTPGTAYPDGLFLLWDNIAKKYILNSDGDNPTFYIPPSSVSARAGIAIKKTAGCNITLGTSQYCLVLPGTSIAKALEITRNYSGAHDHAAMGGAAIFHAALAGLIPKIDLSMNTTTENLSNTWGKYTAVTPDGKRRFGPSSLGDHPEYLSRVGRKELGEAQNSYNDMHGDIRFATKVASGSTNGDMWEGTGTTGWNSETWGTTFGDGSAGIVGRKVGSDLRTGVLSDVDGYTQNASSPEYKTLYRFHGANFLPDAIVSLREHASNDSDLDGPRVFSTLAGAIASGAKSIYLEEGQHSVASAITLSTTIADSNLVIWGAGPASIIKPSANLANIFIITGDAAGATSTNNVTLHDLQIWLTGGTNKNVTSSAIQISNATNPIFYNISFAGAIAKPCISAATSVKNLIVRDCIFGGVIGSVGIDGIALYGTDGYIIENNLFGSIDYECRKGIVDEKTDWSPMTSYNERIIRNNTICSSYSSTTEGLITVNANAPGSPKVIVEGNALRGTFDGVGILCTNQFLPTVTKNNILFAASNDTGYGILLDTCVYAVVADNNIWGSDYAGIQISNSSYVNIIGNEIEGVAGSYAIQVGKTAVADTSFHINIVSNHISEGYINCISTEAPDLVSTSARCYFNIVSNKIDSGKIAIDSVYAFKVANNWIKGTTQGISATSTCNFGQISNNYLSLATNATGTVYGLGASGDCKIHGNTVYFAGTSTGTLRGIYYLETTDGQEVSINDNTVQMAGASINSSSVGIYVNCDGDVQMDNNAIICPKNGVEVIAPLLQFNNNKIGKRRVLDYCTKGILFNGKTVDTVWHASLICIGNTIYADEHVLLTSIDSANNYVYEFNVSNNMFYSELGIKVLNDGAGKTTCRNSCFNGNNFITLNGDYVIYIEELEFSTVCNNVFKGYADNPGYIYLLTTDVGTGYDTIVGNSLWNSGTGDAYAVNLLPAIADNYNMEVEHNTPANHLPPP